MNEHEIAIGGRFREAPVSATPLAVLMFAMLATSGSGGAAFWAWWSPEALDFTPQTALPQALVTGADVRAVPPVGYSLTTQVAAFRDELFAYLMFDFLRHRPERGRSQLLLRFEPGAEQPYELILLGQPDLAASIADAAAMGAALNDWKLLPEVDVRSLEKQTQVFDAAYNLPVKRKLEELPRRAVGAYLRRFIQFKSNTDPRIRRKIEPVPEPLTSEDAQRLAGDIITVAEFYSLPLDFFLGIGAMENNYMNVRGDLEHSIWKRRPAPDDVVLERRRGRVRILNDSAGVWQITRETLRYAHKLVREDKRDYTVLPEHLRPPEQLDMHDVSPQMLTTYAGILLRDLLDLLDGNAMLAAAAYNGGKHRPNLKYGEGVERAAAHARRILEQSAALNGETAVGMTWLRPL